MTQIVILPILFPTKVISKLVGPYPAGAMFRFRTKINLYNVMLMYEHRTYFWNNLCSLRT